jgi:prepilin-type N-terminal cleavage/methylation domain-containing protein
MKAMAENRGFTSLELMIVLTIFGLLLAASWGNIGSMINQHRLTGATNQVATHLRLAREKAVAEGNNYIVTFRVGLNDYQVWDDEGSDSLVGPDDARQEFTMPARTNVQNAAFFGANRIIFRPDGTCNASGSVQVANSEFVRQINVLASTGKITVTTP